MVWTIPRGHSNSSGSFCIWIRLACECSPNIPLYWWGRDLVGGDLKKLTCLDRKCRQPHDNWPMRPRIIVLICFDFPIIRESYYYLFHQMERRLWAKRPFLITSWCPKLGRKHDLIAWRGCVRYLWRRRSGSGSFIRFHQPALCLWRRQHAAQYRVQSGPVCFCSGGSLSWLEDYQASFWNQQI